MNTDRLKEVLAQARQETAKVIIGQHDVIEKALIAIFTGSHALIEGVPGVAKTLLVRTLAQVLGTEFARIQFTPDLMPADITGTNVFNLQRNEFHLIKGPIFTSFLLADEINRAPAKTQSALLQAMQERLVTIDRETHLLSSNFTVFATQNPIEYEGTYPLPEAQKDRFMLKITMGAPERAEELMLAQRTMTKDAPERLLNQNAVQPVIKAEDLATFYGQSIGTWEGDTLVIDSINFDDSTWLGRGGLIHSGSMHIVERLTRVGNEIRYDMRIEDPEMFVEPWVMPTRVLTLNARADGGIMAERSPCEVYEAGNETSQVRH